MEGQEHITRENAPALKRTVRGGGAGEEQEQQDDTRDAGRHGGGRRRHAEELACAVPVGERWMI
jgi:hypothetical protein